MRYEKTAEDIWTISSGQYGNGAYWRIQKVAGVYYYGVQHYDEVFGWVWDNIYRSIDLAPVLEARNNDLRKWGELVKCNLIRVCPFRKAYGYCAKQIGENCPIVWKKEKKDEK